LPPLPVTAEIYPAEIPAELPAPPPPPDGVGLAIAEARVHFDRGAGLYDTGFLKQARSEFDAAVETLLDGSRLYPRNDRIRREMTGLVARIHEMEIAAIRSGDGFTDQGEQHAAIDDLNKVPTFPAPIDPKMKAAVEDDLKDAMHDLPIDLNGRVLSALSYYQNGRGRGTIAVGLERLGMYRPMMERILSEEGVPLDLVFLAQAESAFVPRALSRAKAKGLWQFISSRGAEYGLRQTWWIDERSDPEKSTRAAARHLSDLFEEFKDWNLAMAAYNAGPMRVTNALKKTRSTTFWELVDKKALPKETMNYVPTVLAMAIIGRDPEKYGFNVEPNDPLETERVGMSQATDLRVIAEALGIHVDTLKNLNPQVLRWTTPPGDSEFELILPKGYTDQFNEKVASLPESERVLWRHHEVLKNETLSVIAKKYGITVNDLTQANNINVKKAINVGQSLLIPMTGGARLPVAVASVTTQAQGSKIAVPGTSSSYTVRRGDTLSEIAAKLSVTVNDIKKWNKLSSTRLNVGQKLTIGETKARIAN
jgi:membrane-bound lytic murein transglycosylase D